MILVFAGISFAQSSLVPVIKNSKDSYHSTEKSSVTSFQLKATISEIEKIKAQAATMSTIKFEYKKAKGDVYNCKLTINSYGGTAYVQRIFLSLGFNAFRIDENPERPVTELGEALSKLK